MTPLAAVGAGYLLIGVALAARRVAKVWKPLVKATMRATIDGKSVDLKKHPGFFLGVVIFFAKEVLSWPYQLVLDLTSEREREPEPAEERLPFEFGLDVSRYNLPRGEEYVREVKQVRFELEADIERLIRRPGRHKLVLADVLVDIAREAVVSEIGSGVPTEETDEYLYEIVGRVLEGEVSGAIAGRKPEVKLTA